MNETQRRRFETWLETVRGLDARTIRVRISNCKRVEQFEGDLDAQFDADGLNRLIDRLTYSSEDARYERMPKHNVPIDGDIHNGTATLKSAVNLYRKFRNPIGPERVAGTHEGSPRRQSSPRRKDRPRAQWPSWPQPSDEALLDLARVLAPLSRFLEPEIVGAVAEDNRRCRAEWSPRLDALGIDPSIYLWEDSACAFPGVRRYAGSKEIAEFRQQSKPDAAPSQCLALDDNDYPKHLWAFVFTGRPFRKQGPDGYHLAHPFDHKAHGNRWQDELDLVEGPSEPPPLFGLFTSAANAAYLPSAFVRPTDFSFRLRTLIQKRALELYGDVCRVVPPPLTVKPCKDQGWTLDSFRWSAPVGDMTHVPAFLEFRRERINELIEKRRAAQQ